MNKAEELCHSSGTLKKHKYFEKKAKNDELEHSSGPWKKHKYISKVGEGAKAVYKYAKKAASDPGSAIGTTQRKKWKYYEDRADVNAKAAKEMSDEWDETVKEFGDKPGQDPDKWRYQVHPATIGYKDTTVNWKSYKNKQLEQAKGYRRTANEAKNTYGKTPLGKIEGAAERGKKKIDKLFKSKTKVTVKDTFTGETRTPSKPTSAADTINIKQASEKNKKRKK